MSAPANPVELRHALGTRPFSPAWEALVLAIYGVPLSAVQRRLFKAMAGDVAERPGVGWSECLIVAGRGGGKDDTFATVANFEAMHGGHELFAAPGQRLPYHVVCPLKHQARGSLRFVLGEARTRHAKRSVRRESDNAVEYRSGASVEVQTADQTAIVGDTAIGLWLNEHALMPGDDSASPVRVIESNARPALRRVEGAPLKRIFRTTSAYIREGLSFELFTENHRRETDVLVVSGSTQFFNPNISRDFLAQERRRLGEQLFAMHFECQWQHAITEGWFGVETIARSVRTGQRTLPRPERRPVVISVDHKSSESTRDRFGVAVVSSVAPSKTADGRPIPSRVRVLEVHSWKVTGDPSDSARRLAEEICARFDTWEVVIDQHDRSFVNLLAAERIIARRIPWTGGEHDGSKAERFRSVRTMMASGRLDVPDDEELRSDLAACRATMLPGGSVRIEVRRSTRGHGDVLAAVVMGASLVIETLGSSVRVPDDLWEECAAAVRDAFVSDVAGIAGLSGIGSAGMDGLFGSDDEHQQLTYESMHAPKSEAEWDQRREAISARNAAAFGGFAVGGEARRVW